MLASLVGFWPCGMRLVRLLGVCGVCQVDCCWPVGGRLRAGYYRVAYPLGRCSLGEPQWWGVHSRVGL